MEGNVQVVYQPQVSLRDGRCFGAEVLARLVDRTGPLVPAKDWLGIAEWLGVTGELFEHVVTAVCDDLATGVPVQTKLWFNVAPNDLVRPGGSDWLLEQLSRLKLPISMIGIELTETEAITDPARLAVVLERLRSVGLGLALDDFGARNTPIGHLVDLPVTRVKLDASLVAGIGEDMPPSSWVVKAMAELATRLRIEVMAEGVTSGHQLSLLAKLGVPGAQGYLLGLPGPIDRLPTGVNIKSLLQTSLNGVDAGRPVGPLVHTSGNRISTVTERAHVARSEVGDRRTDPARYPDPAGERSHDERTAG
jgi:EAL domain-containing protein (putative c-di-GMP-specific phosphodiesterase class I)